MDTLTKNYQIMAFDELKRTLHANVNEDGNIQFTIKTPGKKNAIKTYIIRVEDMVFRLTKGNGKIKKQARDYAKKVAVFDLLSGHTCPAALACLRKVFVKDGDITKRFVQNMWTEYPCFAVKAESQYLFVFLKRLINTLLVDAMTEYEMTVELGQLFSKLDIIRIHGAGDFHKKAYYKAMCNVANDNPNKIFYAYSKMLPYVMDDTRPQNFGMTYSDGGKFDDKVDENTPQAIVAFEGQTKTAKFACEDIEDDFEYILRRESFMLHLH